MYCIFLIFQLISEEYLTHPLLLEKCIQTRASALILVQTDVRYREYIHIEKKGQRRRAKKRDRERRSRVPEGKGLRSGDMHSGSFSLSVSISLFRYTILFPPPQSFCSSTQATIPFASGGERRRGKRAYHKAQQSAQSKSQRGQREVEKQCKLSYIRSSIFFFVKSTFPVMLTNFSYKYQRNMKFSTFSLTN